MEINVAHTMRLWIFNSFHGVGTGDQPVLPLGESTALLQSSATFGSSEGLITKCSKLELRDAEDEERESVADCRDTWSATW